jgi:hypothetical protein
MKSGQNSKYDITKTSEDLRSYAGLILTVVVIVDYKSTLVLLILTGIALSSVLMHKNSPPTHITVTLRIEFCVLNFLSILPDFLSQEKLAQINSTKS